METGLCSSDLAFFLFFVDSGIGRLPGKGKRFFVVDQLGTMTLRARLRPSRLGLPQGRTRHRRRSDQLLADRFGPLGQVLAAGQRFMPPSTFPRFQLAWPLSRVIASSCASYRRFSRARDIAHAGASFCCERFMRSGTLRLRLWGRGLARIFCAFLLKRLAEMAKPNREMVAMICI